MMRRGHDFNVLSGIHINAHEYHKEAKNFSLDIANTNAIDSAAIGKLGDPVGYTFTITNTSAASTDPVTINGPWNSSPSFFQ